MVFYEKIRIIVQKVTVINMILEFKDCLHSQSFGSNTLYQNWGFRGAT